MGTEKNGRTKLAKGHTHDPVPVVGDMRDGASQGGTTKMAFGGIFPLTERAALSMTPISFLVQLLEVGENEISIIKPCAVFDFSDIGIRGCIFVVWWNRKGIDTQRQTF